MSRIAVVGAGYVGLVTAAALAKLGHDVTCVDVDLEKVASIKANRLPIEEPDLKPLWQEHQERSTLRMTADYAEAVRGAEFVFLCVGTPPGRNGSVNLLHLISATAATVESLAPEERPILIIKSTVPVGAAELVAAILAQFRSPADRPPVVSNPEFLREGHALEDFLYPTRVIIGSADEAAAQRVAELYAPLDAPIVFCDSRTAELTKYASNAFLATKISFINEFAELSESVDVDVTRVAEVLGLDPDVGPEYLEAGLGWGGSCLPKDLAALIRMAAVHEVSNRLLTAVQKVNDRQPRLVVSKLRRLLGHLDGRTVAVWGLAFKPDCNDTRESPALALIRLLQRQGCRINSYDPMVSLPAPRRRSSLTVCSDLYDAATGADAIVLATAWREFQTVDFRRLRQLVRHPLVVDGRNCLPVAEVEKAGFTYVGVGRSGSARPSSAPSSPADAAPPAPGPDGSRSTTEGRRPQKICVIGAGYVGLTAAACLAKLGHDVTCLDVDVQKVEAIKANRLPISEPNLKPLWQNYQRRATLRMTADYAEAVRGSDFVFLCVGTPPKRDGSANLQFLTRAVTDVMENLAPEDCPILVTKSTVPVGTAEHVAAIGARYRPNGDSPPVVSNPEFLREGRAVQDFLEPPCVVIGSKDETAAQRVAELYEPLGAPMVFCSSRAAELAKYASNAFLATKISFINEIAELCASYDVDVTKVATMLGMDPRVRRAYLGAGLGWGGSCLPKDLAALLAMTSVQGVSSRLLGATQKVNDRQPRLVVGKLRRFLGDLEGRTVAVWGLAFKPDCDDTRDSPALTLIQLLQRQGCRVNAYDPLATFPEGASKSGLTVFNDPYDAATGADAVVLATAWGEFQAVDFRRLRRLVRHPLVVDGRNCLPIQEVQEAGFIYLSVGRATIAPAGRRSVIQVGQISSPGPDGEQGSALSELAASAMTELIRVELP
jgi:UDPglucose 6-dehydrogenase